MDTPETLATLGTYEQDEDQCPPSLQKHTQKTKNMSKMDPIKIRRVSPGAP